MRPQTQRDVRARMLGSARTSSTHQHHGSCALPPLCTADGVALPPAHADDDQYRDRVRSEEDDAAGGDVELAAESSGTAAPGGIAAAAARGTSAGNGSEDDDNDLGKPNRRTI